MQKLVNKLIELNLTLGSCESMTAGLFASSVANISGASKTFKGSIVSYSALVKENLVGVKKETIENFDVVSKEVAIEMAQNAKKLLNVDICVSITGNAGPTSEPGKAKVGEAYIALDIKDLIFYKKLLLEGDRNSIRVKAVEEMKKIIEENLANF